MTTGWAGTVLWMLFGFCCVDAVMRALLVGWLPTYPRRVTFSRGEDVLRIVVLVIYAMALWKALH